MTHHHFSDPHAASIYAAIRASTAGISLAELQAEFPDEEDHPGQLREIINDLRTKGAIKQVAGRYHPAAQPAAAPAKPAASFSGPVGGLFPGLGAPTPTTLNPLSKKQEKKIMKKIAEQLGVRQAVRQVVAEGHCDRDAVATAAGISLKQATDALAQLAKRGELTVIRAGRRGEPAQYAINDNAPAPKLRGRKAGGAGKAGPHTKPTKGTKSAKSAPLPVPGPGWPPLRGAVQTSPDSAHLVGLQANGDAIVVDKLAGSFQIIAAGAVQQLLGFAQLRARA